MDEGEQRVREYFWEHLATEHRNLAKVLDDVESLAEWGSFETARRRFGEYRLAHERHLTAERELEALCAGVREAASFITRLHRERTRVLEQSERVWTSLCREQTAHLHGMLSRLASLVTVHEQAQRRLILGYLPLCSGREQGALLRLVGHL